jgi:type VI secretion system protein ImpK
MDNDLANMVQRVLRHGIQLKERLARGEQFHLKNEQAVLKRLLLSEQDAAHLPEFGSDTPTAPTEDYYGGATQQDRAGLFLGIRYLLVCWLDETFLIDSPWDAQWNENKLELALYGSNDRAWRFWEQARLAETRPGGLALWAAYLCVVLGFRGDLREDPPRLQAWVDAARQRLAQRKPTDWAPPPSREIVTNVPPLMGREALRRMVVSCGIFMLIMLPIAIWFFISYLDQNTPTSTAGGRDSGRSGYGRDIESPKKS